MGIGLVVGATDPKALARIRNHGKNFKELTKLKYNKAAIADHDATSKSTSTSSVTDSEDSDRVGVGNLANVWILAPGVGSQGGSLEDALAAGLDDSGTGLILPISRGISKSLDGPSVAA